MANSTELRNEKNNHVVVSTNQEIQNLQDSYTLLYGVIGNSIIAQLSDVGDSILRESTRRYGADRGRYRRNRHLSANYKINMKNLFSVGSDLPSDPRFFGYLTQLAPQRRTLYNLRCPMAELWKNEGMDYVGRLYCEEFHPACYKEYAFGYTTVNLSKTLTQEGDGYCAFNIVLRPEHLPENLRSVCFEEFDPGYTGPTKVLMRNEAKYGFNLLCIKVIYYIVQVLNEQLGNEVTEKIMDVCLNELAISSLRFLKQSASRESTLMTKEYFFLNYPINLNLEEDEAWQGYTDNQAKSLVQKYFIEKIHNLMM